MLDLNTRHMFKMHRALEREKNGRIEQLSAEKQRLNWERQLIAKDRAALAPGVVAQEAQVALHAASTPPSLARRPLSHRLCTSPSLPGEVRAALS